MPFSRDLRIERIYYFPRSCRAYNPTFPPLIVDYRVADADIIAIVIDRRPLHFIRFPGRIIMRDSARVNPLIEERPFLPVRVLAKTLAPRSLNYKISPSHAVRFRRNFNPPSHPPCIILHGGTFFSPSSRTSRRVFVRDAARQRPRSKRMRGRCVRVPAVQWCTGRVCLSCVCTRVRLTLRYKERDAKEHD